MTFGGSVMREMFLKTDYEKDNNEMLSSVADPEIH